MTDETLVEDRVEGGPWINSTTSRGAASRALLLGFTLLMVGNGLQASVLGVRATSEGFSSTVTGVVMAGYFAGFLIGTQVVQTLLRQVGHIRVFASLTSLASAATLIYAVSVTPVSWFMLRLIFGACMAGLYVVAESWLNDLSTNETRGGLLGAYLVVSMGGAAVGQLMLDATDPLGFGPFVFASVVVSVAALPVALSATSAPPLVDPVPVTMRELLREVPTGLVVSMLVGVGQGTIYGTGSLYGALEGLSDRDVSLVLALPGLGCILFTWPWGRWSDKVGRRPIMVATAAIAAAAAALLSVLTPGGTSSWVALLVLGGTMIPLYSLAVSYTADWIEPHRLNGASAVIVRISGLGAVFGPTVTGALMQATSPAAFFWVLTAVHLAIVAFLAYRMLTADAIQPTGSFAPVPTRSSAVVLSMVRRAPKPRSPEAIKRAARRAGNSARKAGGRQAGDPAGNGDQPSRRTGTSE